MKTHDQVQQQLTTLKQHTLALAGQTDAQAGIYALASALMEAAEALLEGVVDERIVIALDGLSAVLEDDLVKPKPDIQSAASRPMSAA